MRSLLLSSLLLALIACTPDASTNGPPVQRDQVMLPQFTPEEEPAAEVTSGGSGAFTFTTISEPYVGLVRTHEPVALEVHSSIGHVITCNSCAMQLSWPVPEVNEWGLIAPCPDCLLPHYCTGNGVWTWDNTTKMWERVR